MKSTPAIMNWISRAPPNSAASPDRSSLEVSNVKSAPVLRSASARAASSRPVRYTTAPAPARASATIALRFSLSSKATTSGGRLNSMHPKITATRLAKPRQICLIGGIRSENRSGPMATGKQLKAAILARRAAKGPRKKRTRPEPRQYTIADLERARDRVAAAERRIDNDRTNNPNRGRAGLERAQLELSVIESQLRLRGLLGGTAIKPE